MGVAVCTCDLIAPLIIDATPTNLRCVVGWYNYGVKFWGSLLFTPSLRSGPKLSGRETWLH